MVVNTLKVGEDTDVETISDIALRRRGTGNLGYSTTPELQPSLASLRWSGSENRELIEVEKDTAPISQSPMS